MQDEADGAIDYPVRRMGRVTVLRVEYVMGQGDTERIVTEYRDDEGALLFRLDPIGDMGVPDDGEDVDLPEDAPDAGGDEEDRA